MIYVNGGMLEAVQRHEDKELFIFDMDGLIFDSERVFMEQLAVNMMKKNYRLTKDIYLNTLGIGGNRLIDIMKNAYGEDYPFYEISKETQESVGIIADTVGLPVKKGVIESLNWLEANNKKCTVGSSTKTELVKYYLEKAGLDKYFVNITGGEMVSNSKPDPDIFLMACERCETNPCKAVVLEDSSNGIRAAYNAGIETICIPDMIMPSSDVNEMIGYLVNTEIN